MLRGQEMNRLANLICATICVGCVFIFGVFAFPEIVAVLLGCW